MTPPVHLSRRAAIGAVAGTVIATRLPGASIPALAAGDDHGSGAVTLNVTSADTVSPLAAGEQVITIAGATMFAADTTPGSSTVYRPAPYLGNYPDGGGWIGASVQLPAGSRPTYVEFILYGEPISGGVVFNKYQPDSGLRATLLSTPAPAETGPLVVGGPIADEEANGIDAYEAYYYSTATTSVCRGVRIRYLPPASGLAATSPTRVYDSRLPMSPDPSGPLAPGQDRLVHCANGRDTATGAATINDLVPASATAIAYTITVSDTTGSGFLAVNPGGDPTIRASTINWTQPGSAIANTSLVKLGNDRTITVIAGGLGAATHFIIDIVGYYLP